MRVLSTIKQSILNMPRFIIGPVMVARYLVSNQNAIELTIKQFRPYCNRKEGHELKNKIRNDMLRYLITPEEYFLYEFDVRPEREKSTFVGDIERMILCSRLYNSTKSGFIFMDKYRTYQVFERFFGREVMEIKSTCNYTAYENFCKKHGEFVVKPSHSSRGSGIYLDRAITDPEIKKSFERILHNAPCVVEEKIIQGAEMAALHPESVNTIRYATYLKDGAISTIACFIKIGRGSSVVDNGGAGGLLAAVDSESGVIVTPGRTEAGEEFATHPDTNEKIVGRQLPNWKELKGLVTELAAVTPDQPYVGWDLAYSTKGWVLVEGNSGGQFVGPQISKKEGIRNIINETFGSLR